MTKQELLVFIDNNYADDEHVAWQVMSKADVELTIGEDISDGVWSEFNDYTDSNSGMADSLSNEVVEWFEEFKRVVLPERMNLND